MPPFSWLPKWRDLDHHVIPYPGQVHARQGLEPVQYSMLPGNRSHWTRLSILNVDSTLLVNMNAPYFTTYPLWMYNL
jgi:hypothetical protein